jgi:hypothetical protein
MSQEMYESLFDVGTDTHSAHALVGAFTAQARLHRAAMALATDEMMEAFWVEDEDATLGLGEMRFAADDRSETALMYAGGGYTVQLSVDDTGAWFARQLSGAVGASLRFGEDWVVLTPESAAPLPVEQPPKTLVLVDLTGQEHRLLR